MADRGRDVATGHPDDTMLSAVRRATDGASTPEEGARSAAATLRELLRVRSLGIWLRDGDELRLLGYAVGEGVRGEIERKILRSYEHVSLDADLPGPQAMRKRRILHFEKDAAELCLPVRMALVGLGADHLYALPIFHADAVVGCALIGAKAERQLSSAEQRRLGDALGHLARECEAMRLQPGGSAAHPPAT